MVVWMPRLKSSPPFSAWLCPPAAISTASCAAAVASSKSIERPMTGSMTIFDQTNANTPPRAPARSPRPIMCFSMCWSVHYSVAGEAEQVPGIVDEFMDVHVVAEHRGSALVDADEVQHQQR